MVSDSERIREMCEVLEQVREYVEKSLPTHRRLGGERDRRLLLAKIDGVLRR